jgi:EAL and modified HD-GYP domain-containing signal transduction protein
MDAVLDQPLEEIVSELALPQNVRRALLGEAGVLYDALQAAVAYEQGAWATLSGAFSRFSIPESCAPDCFSAAQTTAGAILA